MKSEGSEALETLGSAIGAITRFRRYKKAVARFKRYKKLRELMGKKEEIVMDIGGEHN